MSAGRAQVRQCGCPEAEFASLSRLQRKTKSRQAAALRTLERARFMNCPSIILEDMYDGTASIISYIWTVVTRTVVERRRTDEPRHANRDCVRPYRCCHFRGGG